MRRRATSRAPALPGLGLRAPLADVERPYHLAILNWLRLALPDAVIHHSPNELAIGAPARQRIIVQARAKKLGRLNGFPDILVIWQGRVWGLEVKPPGRAPSPAQLDVGTAMAANGAAWGVARSVDDVARLVGEWLGDDETLRALVRAPLPPLQRGAA